MADTAQHGVFIGVEIDSSVADDGGVAIVEENLDECVLCRLCIDASPPGTVTVHKLYSGETLE